MKLLKVLRVDIWAATRTVKGAGGGSPGIKPQN